VRGLLSHPAYDPRNPNRIRSLVGAFADSMPKGQVMLITNGIKIVGCMMMLITVHPLAAYAIVGFGAAAYSPAKYGILTELLPPQQLVVANGWIEGTTVASIILGVLTGGILIGPKIATVLLGFNMPYIDTGIDTPPEAAISGHSDANALPGSVSGPSTCTPSRRKSVRSSFSTMRGAR